MGRKRRNSGAELIAVAVILVIILNRKQLGNKPIEVIELLPWIAIVIGIAYIGALLGIRIFRTRALQKAPLAAPNVASGTTARVATPAPGTIYLPKPTIVPLRNIDWFQFEKLMELIYSREGYRVERRGGAKPNGGIDLVLISGIERIAVQCKHWKVCEVGVKAICEFLRAMTAERFDSGIFVTSGRISSDAIDFAASNGIRILGHRGINALMARHDAAYDREFRSILDSYDKRCPKCESKMVERVSKKGASAGERFWGCSRYPRCRSVLPIEFKKS